MRKRFYQHWIALLASVTILVPGAYAATITVNSNVDQLDPSGVCTLREAIEAANTNQPVSGCAAGSAVDSDRIIFSFPDPNQILISLADELPSITDPVTIDGATNPGASCPANPGVAIRGNARNYSIRFAPGSDGSVIRGTQIFGHFLCGNFVCLPLYGILVAGANDIKIQCNSLGFGIDGSSPIGSPDRNYRDIYVGSDSQNVIIGADGDGIAESEEGNIFEVGISIELGTSQGVSIRGNQFHNQFGDGWGVYTRATSGLKVGLDPANPDPAHANYFTGTHGVYFDGLLGPAEIYGNVFGMTRDGQVQSLYTGVYVRRDSQIQIGSSSFSDLRLGNRFYVDRPNSRGVAIARLYQPLVAEAMIDGNLFIGPGAGTYPGFDLLGVHNENELGTANLKNNVFTGLETAVKADAGVTRSVQGGNCIEGNSLGASSTPEAIAQLTGNWWGSAYGPAGAGSGEGDPVSGSVSYDPFLSTPPVSCAAVAGLGSVLAIPIISGWHALLLMITLLMAGSVALRRRH